MEAGPPPLHALLRRIDGHRVRTMTVLVGLYLLAWAVTVAAGGSSSAMPHGFYLPVALAAVVFGTGGGALAGIVAAVLCGPFMPLDTTTGEVQAVGNWLTRGIFFTLIGSAVGATATALRHAHGDAVRADLDQHARIEVAVARAGGPSVEVEAELRVLLEERRFHVVFQPIYSFDTGALRSVEALARFDTACPEPPDVWFARAAQLGLGERLELAVIEAALDACATGLPAEVALSLNCSPETLQSPHLLGLLARHPDRDVVVELTEHAVIEDYPGLERAIAALRAGGARLAIDDAGAGFASFRHIVRLAPDIIKLDLSLTQNVRHDPVRKALAGAMVDFAVMTECELIAEGIEQPADLASWSLLGASAVQGFLLARPGPLPAPAPAVVIPRRRPPVLRPEADLTSRGLLG